METIAIIAGVIIAGILAIIGIIRANLKICQPNEVLIFSGRQRLLTDGTSVGYRFIQGGGDTGARDTVRAFERS